MKKEEIKKKNKKEMCDCGIDEVEYYIEVSATDIETGKKELVAGTNMCEHCKDNFSF